MERAGLLDEELRYSLDYEYWIRLVLAGAQFMHLPEVVARFRLSSGSKTVGQTAVMAQEQLRVLEALGSRPESAGTIGLDPRASAAAVCAGRAPVSACRLSMAA